MHVTNGSNYSIKVGLYQTQSTFFKPFTLFFVFIFNLQIDKFKMQRQSRREMPQTHREADELTDRLINARDNNSLHNTKRIKTDRLTISKNCREGF